MSYKVYASEAYVNEETSAKINELKASGGVGYTETEKTVVFQRDALTIPYDGDEGMSAAFFNPAPFEIVLGKEYEAIWNGDTYKLVGAAVDEEISMVYIGNPKIEGKEDNGVPFAIAYGEANGMSQIDIVCPFATEDVTVSLSVSTETETTHTIDPKFLPNGGGLPVVEVTYLDLVLAGLRTEDADALKNAILNGTPFILKGTYKALNDTGESMSEDGLPDVTSETVVSVYSIEGVKFCYLTALTANMKEWKYIAAVENGEMFIEKFE